MGESMRYQVEAQWMTSDMVIALFEYLDDAVRFAVDKFENDQLFHLANIYVVDVLNDEVYTKWERSH
jgi:hypothetical protein